jgi:protein FAM50
MAHYKGDANEATRAMHISRRREKAKEELEEKRKKIEGDVKLSTIDNKFATHTDSVEAQLKSSTVGLVTLDQMRQKQENAVKEREKQLAQKESDKSLKIDLELGLKKHSKMNSNSKTLSFYDDDDDEDDEEDDGESAAKGDNCNTGDSKKDILTHSSSPDGSENNSSPSSNSRKKAKLAWDKLDVDTSLLPDRDREEEERRLREKLAAEWRERQQKLKEEEIEITFSYWDGSGHRRMVVARVDHYFLSTFMRMSD